MTKDPTLETAISTLFSFCREESWSREQFLGAVTLLSDLFGPLVAMTALAEGCRRAVRSADHSGREVLPVQSV